MALLTGKLYLLNLRINGNLHKLYFDAADERDAFIADLQSHAGQELGAVKYPEKSDGEAD
jgi:hypothetical protein